MKKKIQLMVLGLEKLYIVPKSDPKILNNKELSKSTIPNILKFFESTVLNYGKRFNISIPNTTMVFIFLLNFK